ncbi:hypothetical protein Q0N40_03600 [Corynebacterium pseudokroppenstedtii]|uniref:Secreted protein n=1 Tax=Corynebacterium pseudokroppenstedtii TaxID=2804917 RepID=A0AAU0Q2T0_9CORY|nr:hypothetical protein [Corynebacterium pseudokroppenstedtii]MBY0790850.1 hypothetical protein [Corynebacterium pseudokroppenstedtii]MCF8702604.1 hypothetical protein [Corynebacterium pseudokroppenstedtii]MCG2636120.1 hypothetical protein [Corynebacterium pseudokroppenstedtii]
MKLSWGPRKEDGGVAHLDLFRDDELIAQFSQSRELTSARVKPSGAVAGGAHQPSPQSSANPESWPEWTFVPHTKGRLSASGPDGQNFHADPQSQREGKEGQIGRAKRVALDMGIAEASSSDQASASAGVSESSNTSEGIPAVNIVNCGKLDFVFETPDETKLGQFTGGNRGVRHVVVELEPGQEAAMTTEQQVFLAWVARMQLESRLVASTWMWTVLLIVLLPFMLLVFLL